MYLYHLCVCVYVGRVAAVVKSKGSCDAVAMSFCLRVDCYLASVSEFCSNKS